MPTETTSRIPTPFGFDFMQTTLSLSDELSNLSEKDITDVNIIVKSQLKTLGKVHGLQVAQANTSFLWALRAGAIGLVFLVASLGFLLIQHLQSLSLASLVSGTVIEFIAAIQLYIFKNASERLERTQVRIDDMLQFLLANGMAEKLTGDHKQQVRGDIIRAYIGLTNSGDQLTDTT